MCVLIAKVSAKPDEHSGFLLKPPKNEANEKEMSKSKAIKEQQREERERLVLWYEPVLTLKYSTLETVELLRTHGQK